MPAIVTIWILVWGYKFIQSSIGVHINRLLAWLTIFMQGGPDNVDAQWWRNFWIHGLGSLAGFVIALVIVLAMGAIVANVVGRSLWRVVERFIMTAPVINQIYPHIKQVTDFLLSQEKTKNLFSRVVLVEFPRKGCWTVGMVTGAGIKRLVDSVEKEFLTVFIAHSPSPITGFVVIIPKDETIDADMTVEEAFRFIISGGVITPHSSTEVALTPQPELENVKL